MVVAVFHRTNKPFQPNKQSDKTKTKKKWNEMTQINIDCVFQPKMILQWHYTPLRHSRKKKVSAFGKCNISINQLHTHTHTFCISHLDIETHRVGRRKLPNISQCGEYSCHASVFRSGCAFPVPSLSWYHLSDIH